MITFNSKKGAVTDAIYVPIYILVLSITAIIGVYIWIQFNGAFTSVVTNTIYSSNATQNNATRQLILDTMSQTGSGLSAIDYMFPLLISGLLVISLITAYKTGSSVIYVFVSLLFWGFAMLVSAILSNVYQTFLDSLPGIAAASPIITFINLNMKWLVLGWLVLVSVVMFTRNKQDDRNIRNAEAYYGYQ